MPVKNGRVIDFDVGDVHSDLGYHLVGPSLEVRAYEFRRFNSSAAAVVGNNAQTTYTSAANNFLIDTKVIDLTSIQNPDRSCSSGYDFKRNSVCTRAVFLPITMVAAVDETYPNADLIVVHDVRGYYLDFSPLEATFNFRNTSYCRIYGRDVMAAQYCFAPASDGRIAASKGPTLKLY